MQVIPCAQRDALYCLHENGCITLRVCRSTTAEEATGTKCLLGTHTCRHKGHIFTHRLPSLLCRCPVLIHLAKLLCSQSL